MVVPTSICRPIVCDSVGMTVNVLFIRGEQELKRRRREEWRNNE